MILFVVIFYRASTSTHFMKYSIHFRINYLLPKALGNDLGISILHWMKGYKDIIMGSSAKGWHYTRASL
jgi:hypothetical protein